MLTPAMFFVNMGRNLRLGEVDKHVPGKIQ